ncbi:hypothetical protein H671_1g3045 [Cricetulus griseus]|nr:hypothetical protein H671_1g3045 [Cricetulus griseus]
MALSSVVHAESWRDTVCCGLGKGKVFLQRPRGIPLGDRTEVLLITVPAKRKTEDSTLLFTVKGKAYKTYMKQTVKSSVTWKQQLAPWSGLAHNKRQIQPHQLLVGDNQPDSSGTRAQHQVPPKHFSQPSDLAASPRFRHHP